jgi:hypothetical protein
VIRYFYIGYGGVKQAHKPYMYYKAKITKSNYSHKCELSEPFYHQTINPREVKENQILKE